MASFKWIPFIIIRIGIETVVRQMICTLIDCKNIKNWWIFTNSYEPVKKLVLRHKEEAGGETGGMILFRFSTTQCLSTLKHTVSNQSNSTWWDHIRQRDVRRPTQRSTKHTRTLLLKLVSVFVCLNGCRRVLNLARTHLDAACSPQTNK